MKPLFLLFAACAAVSLASASELPIPTQPGTYSSGLWTYTYTIEHKGTRSEKRIGKLTYKGTELKAVPGSILKSPFGRLVRFDTSPAFSTNQGWLNTSSYNRPIFEADGKLADELARQFKEGTPEVDLAKVLEQTKANDSIPGKAR